MLLNIKVEFRYFDQLLKIRFQLIDGCQSGLEIIGFQLSGTISSTNLALEIHKEQKEEKIGTGQVTPFSKNCLRHRSLYKALYIL